MFASLRSRLVLSNLLITLLGLAVVVVVFTHLLNERSTAVSKAERADDARRIAAQIERLFAQGGGPVELRQEVYLASRLLGMRVIVARTDGRFVVDSKQKTPYYTGSWHLLDTKALKAASDATVAVQRDENLYRFQAPITGTHHRNLGAVLVVARVADVRPTTASLLGVVLTVVGAALAVWLLISLYFTYSISHPLLHIAEATNRMARGDYSARAKVRGQGEIARLAASFNTMASRVEQSNRVLRDFLANVSHDLRTPLTMITGFSQALLDGTARREEVAESAAVIHEEALRMQQLVDDLLQLTRLESGLLQLERHAVHPRSFVQSVVDRMQRARSGRPAATIENLVPTELPPLYVDPGRIERALTNLLNNALEYTDPAGQVTIEGRNVDHAWIELSIQDTGKGIPREDLPRIFERFYRADKSRGRQHGHFGLGLPIVREIVEAHGGRIKVESEVGRGTNFRLTVPRAEPHAIAAETVRSRESLHQAAT